MEFMTTLEATKQWSVTVRQVQSWCSNGKIEGVTRVGRMWLIPKVAPKPVDGRTKAARGANEKEFT